MNANTFEQAYEFLFWLHYERDKRFDEVNEHGFSVGEPWTKEIDGREYTEADLETAIKLFSLYTEMSYEEGCDLFNKCYKSWKVQYKIIYEGQEHKPEPEKLPRSIFEDPSTPIPEFSF